MQKALVCLARLGHERGSIVELHPHGLEIDSRPGFLCLEGEGDSLIGLDPKVKVVGRKPGHTDVIEQVGRGLPKRDDHLGGSAAEALARAKEDRDPCPPPVVDARPNRSEGLRFRVGGHVVLVEVSGYPLLPHSSPNILAPHNLGRLKGAEGPQKLDDLLPYGLGIKRSGRFHGQEREDLQRVVLDDVPDRPGLIVVAPAPLHPDRFGHGDLNVVDRVPVPDALEHGVGEPEDQDVLDRLLSQEVIDPKYLGLIEDLSYDPIELPGAGQISAEGLLDHDACPLLGAELSDSADRVGKGRGWGRAIVQGCPLDSPLLPQSVEQLLEMDHARRIGELPAHIVQRVCEPLPDILINRTASELLHAPAGMVPERFLVPSRSYPTIAHGSGSSSFWARL